MNCWDFSWKRCSGVKMILARHPLLSYIFPAESIIATCSSPAHSNSARLMNDFRYVHAPMHPLRQFMEYCISLMNVWVHSWGSRVSRDFLDPNAVWIWHHLASFRLISSWLIAIKNNCSWLPLRTIEIGCRGQSSPMCTCSSPFL